MLHGLESVQAECGVAAREMLQGQALPAEAVAKIRSFDGNGRCMDCRSPEPDWADVSHGTVILLV